MLRLLFLYTELMSEQLYAVFPGTVTLYDGTTKTWTAEDLAAAYGVEDTDYLVCNSELDLPRNPLQQMLYVRLTPRGDDRYPNIMYTAEDDGEDVAYRPDFDASKEYTQETDPLNVEPDIDLQFQTSNNYTKQ